MNETRLALERLSDALRPDLHRYAARLMGSVIDGEDVVQDTLVRAFAAVDGLDPGTPLRPWLFRIAHNRAVDLLRQSARWPTEDTLPEDSNAPSGEAATLQREELNLAVSRFLALSVPQRATVALKDLLDEPLAEIAALLDLSLDAVKAHLARGRARLRDPAPAAPSPPTPETAHFARLFNQQDWAALRALLAEDVRLNQARRALRAGKAEVAPFFTFYEAYPPVRLEPAWLEGREVLLVYDLGATRPGYFMRLTWDNGQITEIRDHRYATYVLDD